MPESNPGHVIPQPSGMSHDVQFFFTYLTYCTTNKLFELKFILCTISRLRRYHDSWKCGGSFEARQTAEAVVYCGFESDFSPHVTDQGREGILLIRLEKNIWIILEMIMFFFLNRGKSWNKFAFRPSHLGVLTEYIDHIDQSKYEPFRRVCRMCHACLTGRDSLPSTWRPEEARRRWSRYCSWYSKQYKYTYIFNKKTKASLTGHDFFLLKILFYFSFILSITLFKCNI